jgi:glycosyltransferase involved in cell wall biosynthesis
MLFQEAKKPTSHYHFMHLGIDIREACSSRPTGKGMWTRGFSAEMLKRELRLSLFTDAALPPDLESLAKKSGASVVFLPQKGFAWHRAVAGMLKPSGVQLYVSPVSFIVPALVGGSVRCVPVVHDLIAFRPEPHDRKAKIIEYLTLGRAVKKAFRVCTVSQSTKADLLARYAGLEASKVLPIFAGGGEETATPSVSDGSTIVCIGTLSPRKNQLRLIKAFASLPSPLREKAKLWLIGGRGWDDDEIIALAASTPGVEWKGYLDDAAMDAVLRRAAVFALPSLYEGFGLPLLTAMRRGIPMLISERGSLREVAGDAALSADPESESSVAASLEKLLTDDALRDRLIGAGREQAKRFTWERTVSLFLEGIR